MNGLEDVQRSDRGHGEVYIDDMVVKSKKSEEHVPNLVDVF